MRPTSQSPSAIASRTSTSEPEDLGVVRHPAAQHPLGGGAAVLREPVGDERDVVLARARAEAEPALPARVAEALVGRHVVRPHALGRAHDRAGALGERLPGVDDAGLLGAPEVRGVHRDQHVRRRVRALRAQPLVELGRGPAADREVGARLLGEVLERLLLAVVRARRVERRAPPTRSRTWRAPHRRRRPTSRTAPPMTMASSRRRDIGYGVGLGPGRLGPGGLGLGRAGGLGAPSCRSRWSPCRFRPRTGRRRRGPRRRRRHRRLPRRRLPPRSATVAVFLSMRIRVA